MTPSKCCICGKEEFFYENAQGNSYCKDCYQKASSNEEDIAQNIVENLKKALYWKMLTKEFAIPIVMKICGQTKKEAEETLK